jgi:hypothetical protein
MTINEDFWFSYTLTEQELEDIYNFLLETETPLDKFEITKFIIGKAITAQEEKLKSQQLALGTLYLPEKQYSKGDVLVFPTRSNEVGKVRAIRSGFNPDYAELQVIDVDFESGASASFAANIKDHKLNDPVPVKKDDLLDADFVFEEFGTRLVESVAESCATSNDLVCIARHYFPRALLFDISIGHLNLCEAVLEMANGGPLSTKELIEQIELPASNNEYLTEFSLNYALEKDGRFDEVGPSGITLWFLKRLEPMEVQKPPMPLVFSGKLPESHAELAGLDELNRLVFDELEEDEVDSALTDEAIISLSYPHWRAGTLPLTNRVKGIFPTAHETPRVKFNFSDGNSQEKFSGWVVRPNKYVFGLREWYEQQGAIPGSNITVRRGKESGEVIIQTQKSKNSRDWIKTVLVGTDGGIVFALLKQVISCTFDDRMAIMIPDVNAIDSIWTSSSRAKQPVEKVVQTVMREMGKLNLQNQIHAQELYAAVNVVRRVSTSQVLSILYTQPWAKHLGDLYFKLEETSSS